MCGILKTWILLIALAAIWAPTSSLAALTALVSIREGDQNVWEKRTGLRELFQTQFGFDDVQFLVDATSDEIPARLKSFLEEDAQPEDRRFVWISGFDKYSSGSICANASFGPIQPTATSLILAPSCYTEVIALPQGARHYSLTAPDPTNTAARIGRTRASSAPWIALLTLPSSNETTIEGANNLITQHLTSSLGHNLDPAALLHHLRMAFRWNGSDYTPTLDLFDRASDRKRLLPFAIARDQVHEKAAAKGMPRVIQKNSFALFRNPNAADGLALSSQHHPVLHVLRRDRSGDMHFVTTGTGFFGWVKADAFVQ